MATTTTSLNFPSLKSELGLEILILILIKADLGICHNIHDDEMKKQFDAAKENSRKLAAEDEFLR